MNRFKLIFLSLCILFCSACKKEIGKKEYSLTMIFEDNSVVHFDGKIVEKYKKNKKYLDQIDGGYSLKKIDGVGLYLDFSNDNTCIAIKTLDEKIIVNTYWEFWNNFPAIYSNNQSGMVAGDIYLEGSYSQKGRAYTVEDGDFEFYWRNAEDFGMTDTILKGKWTLKRK